MVQVLQILLVTTAISVLHHLCSLIPLHFTQSDLNTWEVFYTTAALGTQFPVEPLVEPNVHWWASEDRHWRQSSFADSHTWGLLLSSTAKSVQISILAIVKSLSFKTNQAGSKTPLESYLLEDAKGIIVRELLLYETELMYIWLFAKIMAQKGKNIRKKISILCLHIQFTQGHNLLKIRNFNIAFLHNRKHIYNVSWICVMCPLE